jgi:hypothetical protein
LLLDEFYSHYVWTDAADRQGLPVESAARYVEDVDRDPVVIVDGLTKNWRYPGWRVAWTVGPRAVIDAVASAGSFLDGGGSRLLQRAAIGMLGEEHVASETRAISSHFRKKRDYLLGRLRGIGVEVDLEPQGTFYVWGRLNRLPEPLADGVGLFRAALERKVILVPGMFFDVNPGKRRSAEHSRFRAYARFSFGPSLDVLERACDRLAELVQERR